MNPSPTCVSQFKGYWPSYFWQWGMCSSSWGLTPRWGVLWNHGPLEPGIATMKTPSKWFCEQDFTSGRSKQCVRELQKNNDAMTGSTFTILPLWPVSWTLLALNASHFCLALHHDDHSSILFILRQSNRTLPTDSYGNPLSILYCLSICSSH